MRVGGVRRVVIPPNLGYGNNPPPTRDIRAERDAGRSRSSCSAGPVAYFGKRPSATSRSSRAWRTASSACATMSLLIARRALRVDHLDVGRRAGVEGDDRDLQHFVGRAAPRWRALASARSRASTAARAMRTSERASICTCSSDSVDASKHRFALAPHAAALAAVEERLRQLQRQRPACATAGRMPDGVSSCGPNVTDAAGHQSLRLSLTMRSLASRCGGEHAHVGTVRQPLGLGASRRDLERRLAARHRPAHWRPAARRALPARARTLRRKHLEQRFVGAPGSAPSAARSSGCRRRPRGAGCCSRAARARSRSRSG